MSTSDDLFAAVQRGDQQQVAALLAGDPALLRANSHGGTSLVLWAVYTGQTAMAHDLVRQGAPVTLFEAAALGLDDLLRREIAAAPDSVNAHAPDGFTALGLAAFFGNVAAVEILLEHGASPNVASSNAQHVTPLHSAVAHGHTDIARLLIAHGADVDARQEGDFTPLHEAAHRGSVDLVRLLLDAGANPDLRDASGKTTLDHAKESSNPAVVMLLEEREQ